MAESQNVAKLDALLSPYKQEVNLLSEALAEINKEDVVQKLAQAKDLIRSAMALKKRMSDSEREHRKQQGKFEKELGKVMKRIDNMVKGSPVDEGVDEKPEEGAPKEE